MAGLDPAIPIRRALPR